MSRKLLKEETVSKFMKLANISGDRQRHFLKENYVEEDLEEGSEELDEYNSLEEETYGLEEDFLEEAGEEELAPEEDLPAEEDEGEGEMGTVDVSADDVRKAIEAFDNLQPIINSLRDAVEGGEPEAEEPEAEEPEGEEPEMPPPEGEEAAEAPLPPEGEEEEGLMQEALVNKIAKRVAARLLKESKK